MLRSRSWPQVLSRVLRPNCQGVTFFLSSSHRPFTQSPALPAKPLPPRLKINDADLTLSYLKGTGPGGQKINKTNSAVQIIHHPSGVVVKCQATRSRSQNEKIARQLLADKVEAREKGEQSRVALKAEAARKKKASKMKKAKRKYRSLDEANRMGEDEGIDNDGIETEKRAVEEETDPEQSDKRSL
ncbi:peptide chain release factor-like protein [Penicillium macrosclerotiorum]|uniref:peptide chain release factor-like protein n=1 Tax=Penicillium macrosclerotiorum TaxID=303699 RepID=UPI00254910BE|nr:peptide chain release factor-like protein [Penicillium macrosclerotiorum]KAJ5669317.1 peptide chain release factor-like protein [Penicillium macrosclerotiorum]